MTWWGILLIVLGFGIFTFMGGAVASYLIIFKSPYAKQQDIYAVPEGSQYDPFREEMKEKIRILHERPFERVEVTSFDGLKLVGKYYHTADGAPLDICFHGYRGTAERDFCYGSEICLGLGHNVLLVDERAHGESGGRCLTLGILERYDCVTWAKYAAGRFGPDTEIVLMGVSMGASVVLLATELGLPPEVKGIIADAPYDSPVMIMRHLMNKMKFPERILFPMTAAGALLFGGFRIRNISAAEAAGRSGLPMLVIHGTTDLFVPWTMSVRIGTENPNVERHTFPNSGHILSYMNYPEEYVALVKGFYDRVL